MRTLFLSAALTMANAASLLAQENAGGEAGGGLMNVRINLMFWTLLIFVFLYLLLRWKASNMIAGHVIILALIGLIFLFGYAVALAAIPMALFIMFLEILVAFIQAFVFALLAAVFIGQIRAAHH